MKCIFVVTKDLYARNTLTKCCDIYSIQSPNTGQKRGQSCRFSDFWSVPYFYSKIGKKYKREFYIDMKFGTGTQLRNKTYMTLSKKGK